jgi:hypothetical protein
MRPAKEARKVPVHGRLQGPVRVGPAGELVALVAAGPRRLQLVRWSPAGTETQRRELDLPGQVAAWRLLPDGGLTVVTTAVLARLDAAGRISARRPLALPVAEALGVAVGLADVWLAFPDRLVHAGLEGDPRTRPAPISTPGHDFRFLAMVATASGECLVAEGLHVSYPVSGTAAQDLSVQTVLSLLDAQGRVLATRTLGEIDTWRQWFWSETLPGNASALPSSMGLVRTRHGGTTEIALLAEAAPSGFLAVGANLIRLDRQLQLTWSLPLGYGLPVVLSPPWGSGLVLVAKGRHAFPFDEKGATEFQAPSIAAQEGGPDLSRAALGRDPSGGWFLVTY